MPAGVKLLLPQGESLWVCNYYDIVFDLNE